MSNEAAQPPLRLVRVAGPPALPIEIAPGARALLGRAIECEVCLADPTVSRKHVTIQSRADRWFITDLGSRAGTLLNAVALPPEKPSPLERGDLLSVGPWLFRVDIGKDKTVSMNTIDDSGGPATFLETIGENQLAGMAQHRLTLLLDYATELNKAASEAELAGVVLRCAVAGSGITRAAFVKPFAEGSKVEVVASFNAENESQDAFDISRSLLREAAAGRVARLSTRMAADVAVSIADLGIHSALAVPIQVDAAVVACLYMDARGGESRVRTDAADFCIALARLCGLAFANLKRDELQKRHRELEAELSAARKAQELIVPVSGAVEGISYSVAMRPGSFVAGDLFDVVVLGPGRVAVCIGDVTGHGVGAGILMAATQANLNATLRMFGDPGKAIAATNAYLAAHAASNQFVSLWVGVFDRGTRSLTCVDAGHGHWLIMSPEGPHTVESAGGPPLGIEPDFEYPSLTLPFPASAAALLYSDGIVEQRSPSREMFGTARIEVAAGASIDPASIIKAVLRHAETEALDDDATVAVVRWAE